MTTGTPAVTADRRSVARQSFDQRLASAVATVPVLRHSALSTTPNRLHMMNRRPRRPAARSISSSGRQSEPESLHLKSASDRLLLAASSDLTGPDVLVLLLYGTTLASGLRSARPELNYTFYTPEHFFLSTLELFHPECRHVHEAALDSTTPALAEPSVCLTGQAADTGAQLRLVCAPDPPAEEFDCVVFPTNAVGSAEQTQELLQIAHQRLRSGGRLLVSTNNASDKWLHERLRELFERTTVCQQRDGVLYIAHKTAPLKKVRNFRAEFAFRCGAKLVWLESLPGVFSHRRVDGGARALIRSLELLQADAEGSTGKPLHPLRIADLGCGCGAVALAAALQYPEAQVLAVDSHARAIACTRNSAARNQLERIDTLLASDAVLPNPNAWDLILTNPPYYSDFRISELFLQSARTALRPGGRVHLVTKLTDWHVARMSQLFRDVAAHRIGEYDVVTAVKR